MFNSIEIENLRGIKNLKIDDIKRFNLFVGKNNCGKTTLLESIFYTIGPTNSLLPLNTNSFRGLNVVGKEIWSIFFNDLNIDKKIKIQTKSDLIFENRTLEISPVFDYPSEQEVKIISQTTWSIRNITGLNIQYTINKSKSKKPIKFLSKVIQTQEGVKPTKPPSEYKEKLNGVFLNPHPFQEDTVKRFSEMKVSKQVEKIITILKKIEPKISDLALSHTGLIYCDIGLNQMIPINALGDGLFRLLKILLAIIYAENGIVLIDEIDDGFHHTSQNILWEGIFITAKKFNVQIFATTHSMECVRAFSESYSKFNEEGDDIRLYRLEKKEDLHKIIKYDSKSVKSTIESGWEMR